MATVQLVSEALAHSLAAEPQTRTQAEKTLGQSERLPDYPFVLIAIASDAALGLPIRLAAALAFKNWVKSCWPADEHPDQKTQLKSQLVAVLVSLVDAPALQTQFQEAIALIAHSDFPNNWPDLIHQLVQSFNPNHWKINHSLLATAHAIFKSWRSQFRSDDLFLQIKYVLQHFCEPYLKLFKLLDQALSSPNLTTLSPSGQSDLLKSLLLIIQLYYDLNSQDIPEFFEDHLPEFMSLLHKYLTWDNPQLAIHSTGREDDEAGELEKIKSSICQVIELYSQRYLDVFPMMGSFAETVWALLTGLGQEQRYDILVSKATRFLSVVVRMPSQRTLFESDATLRAFCERIVLPNMILRDFEIEMFEDDPAEYVRRDLEGSDSDTRRQAASNFTRALMDQFDSKVTQIITTYVQDHLQKYAENTLANWKSKDAAVSLLASVASLSSTSTGGVTMTNTLVDVVRFFSDHVIQDLAPSTNTPHNIILADAIKFLHTFRNQLTREQLIEVLPLLVPHLRSEVVVVHSYAAHTIERILFIKRDNKLLFSASDIQALALEILQALFVQIRKGSTPQLVAQNDVLMKCVMRIIVTARHSLVPHFQSILSNLIAILDEICKNPSNPKFNHYCFESISALIRFMTVNDAVAIEEFEKVLFPPFTFILSQDIQDFSPFVFQILSQLLELHKEHQQQRPLPEYYLNLLQPLLTPNLWEVKGNIPALVRLLCAYLSVGTQWVIEGNRVPGMLGVFQKLVGSRLSDQYGFELLEGLFEHIPMQNLTNYLRNIFIILLTRLQASKTEKFTRGLIHFVMFALTLEKEGLNPDLIIATFNSVQPGLFCQVMEGVILPSIPETPLKDRRLVALGHVSLLTRSRTLQTDSEARLYAPILKSVLQIFILPQVSLPNTAARQQQEEVEEIEEVQVAELEENGYQVGFSMLGASKTTSKSPVAKTFEAMGDPKDALAIGLVRVGEAQPAKIPQIFSQVDSDLATPYLQWLSAAGYQIK